MPARKATTIPSSTDANANGPSRGRGEGGTRMGYEKPMIVDYGNLVTLTEATTIVGTEDGASKLTTENHHSVP
jgi:hypothetical protein